VHAITIANEAKNISHAWADSCAAIVELLDDPRLPSMIGRSLSTLLSFDDCKLLVYGEKTPVFVHADSPVDYTHPGLRNFLEHSYLISPFYRLYRSGGAAGVHRLKDISHFKEPNINPSRHRVSMMASEEIGYVTDGMQSGNEELCVGLPIPNGDCTLISLTREKCQAGFSASEVNLVKTVVPFLSAVLRRYWATSTVSVCRVAKVPTKKDVALQKLSTLSPREQEIVRLLIEGHSSLSISLQLGISGTTVKTHRKNLYAKLGIATQCELFSMHVDTLGI
jgi:DNA-binding CsgD family transcriptional regulator